MAVCYFLIATSIIYHTNTGNLSFPERISQSVNMFSQVVSEENFSSTDFNPEILKTLASDELVSSLGLISSIALVFSILLFMMLSLLLYIEGFLINALVWLIFFLFERFEVIVSTKVTLQDVKRLV